MSARQDPKARTVELLDVALRLAETNGWQTLTHAGVARTAGVSNGLVVARLGTMDAMRRAVMRRAVAARCVRVVAEGLVARDRYAQRADEALREECAALMRAAA